MNRKAPATVTFQFFFEAIPDAAVAVDDKGYIVLANALAETMFGYRPKALLGKRLEILLPGCIRKLRAKHRDYFTNPRTRPMVASLHLVGRRKDGTEFPVDINLAPLRTEEGIWSVAVIRDLTESRTLRHELAHGQLEDSGHRLDSDGRHYLQVIQENTQKMGHMIDDLLEFSRLGRQEMKLSSFDLGALAAEVFEELRRAEDTREVQFKLEPLPPARGDRVMLRQVLVNLLSNAMKFTRTKDTAVVQMGGSEQEGENVYCVKDNGVGFDRQYAHKLFGVFQRLHSQEEFEGTGVGLAIVRQIVQRHGGRIWAEAKLGQEAKFFFTLPKGLTS